MSAGAVRAVTEFAASRHGVITRSQAASCGLTAARLATAVRQGWLVERHPGVFVVAGAPSTDRLRLLAATDAVRGTVVSHRAAARLHRLDGFGHGSLVEVSVERRRRWQLPAPATTHHVCCLEPLDVTRVDGIPVTTIARTLADLGSVVKQVELVRRAVTDARRRRVPLASLRETQERLHRPGQSGTGILRRILDSIPFEGAVSDSWFEELVAACLDDPRIPTPVRQHPIVGVDGSVVARVDLALPSVRVGIEAHSRRFHFGPEAERLDETRDLAVAAAGWELIYVGWHQTKRPRAVADAIAAVVAARRRER